MTTTSGYKLNEDMESLGLVTAWSFHRVFPHSSCYKYAGPSVANRLISSYRTLLIFNGIFTFLVSAFPVTPATHLAFQKSDELLQKDLGGLLQNIKASMGARARGQSMLTCYE